MSAGSTPQVRQPAFRALQTSSIGQRLDHSAVASGSGESELDGSVGVRPDEPMHAEMIALQLLGRRQVLVG